MPTFVITNILRGAAVELFLFIWAESKNNYYSFKHYLLVSSSIVRKKLAIKHPLWG